MPPQAPVIALLPWGNVIEDFLDAIEISFEQFCQEMTGGWLFGYIEALSRVGIHSVLICISAQVQAPTRFQHEPTGATIWALPPSMIYRLIHRHMVNPYGFTVKETFGKAQRPWLAPVLAPLKEISPYLATPVRSLATILKQENCQAIVCQEYEYARFDICCWLGRQLNLPVYASFQGGDFQTSRLEKRVRSSSINSCAGLIVAPHSEISRIQTKYNLPTRKIARIFNPLDLTLWEGGEGTAVRHQLGISPRAQVVVWHGRVDLHRKGLDILLESWSALSQQRPHQDLHLLLVGTGTDAKQLQQTINYLQLTNLHWINEYILDRERLRDYLHAADIYVLPSRHEGFAVAPLEAMACKLPIVATDAPGVPDILEGGEDAGGLIVPKANTQALATALGQLLDNDSLRQRLAASAYQRVQSAFSLKVVGQQLNDFLSL